MGTGWVGPYNPVYVQFLHGAKFTHFKEEQELPTYRGSTIVSNKLKVTCPCLQLFRHFTQTSPPLFWLTKMGACISTAMSCTMHVYQKKTFPFASPWGCPHFIFSESPKHKKNCMASNVSFKNPPQNGFPTSKKFGEKLLPQTHRTGAGGHPAQLWFRECLDVVVLPGVSRPWVVEGFQGSDGFFFRDRETDRDRTGWGFMEELEVGRL